jgi:hypothetical protein
MIINKVSFLLPVLFEYSVGNGGHIIANSLKGQCHEIFDSRFFPSNNPP